MPFSDYKDITHNRMVALYHDAIIKLVLSNTVEKITIQMILDETQTSKRTFYRYFPDKFALMNYVCYHGLAPQFAIDLTDKYMSGILLNSKFFYDNKDYFRKLYCYKGQNNFYDWHSNAIYEYTKAQLIKLNGNENYTPTVDYRIRTYTKGIVDAFRDWINKDCKDVDYERFAYISNSLLPHELIEAKMAISGSSLDHGSNSSINDLSESS